MADRTDVSTDALIDQVALLVAELQKRQEPAREGHAGKKGGGQAPSEGSVTHRKNSSEVKPLLSIERPAPSSTAKARPSELSPNLQPERPALYPHKPQAATSILKRSDLGQELSEALKLPKFEG